VGSHSNALLGWTRYSLGVLWCGRLVFSFWYGGRFSTTRSTSLSLAGLHLFKAPDRHFATTLNLSGGAVSSRSTAVGPIALSLLVLLLGGGSLDRSRMADPRELTVPRQLRTASVVR